MRWKIHMAKSTFVIYEVFYAKVLLNPHEQDKDNIFFDNFVYLTWDFESLKQLRLLLQSQKVQRKRNFKFKQDRII